MVWSEHLTNLDAKLNVRGVEWKNLMSECLMATQIKRNESFSEKCLNPNVVMTIRHQMAKESIKTPSIPQCQIQNEAMKLLREENSQKLLRMKEENIIRKEIEKLKQMWEFNAMLTKKYLETDEKRIREPPLPKISSKDLKLWLLKPNKQYRAEKIKHAEISNKEVKDTKKVETVYTKRECLDREKDEVCTQANNESHDENCMKTFKKPETDEREITKMEIKLLPPLQNKLNQKRLKRAWQTWRIYIQRRRRRERDKKMYVDKIEAFLEKLRKPQEETKAKLRVSTCKQEPKTFKLPERAKTAIDNNRLEELQKLMREVKTSQTEVLQRLRSRNESMAKSFPNPKFLFRMEERREERLKRRREIQERKQKLKEEKENVERQKEEEEKKLREQEKQKRMEELKEKRRIAKEKKEEEREKRDKLRRDEFLANYHYREFLLRNYGLRPWLKLMKLADAKYKQASQFYDRRLLVSLVKWRTSVREQLERKEKRAEQLYHRNLLQRCWSNWVELRMKRISEEQVAVDWNDFKITEKTFRNWMWFTEKEQLVYLYKNETADLHYKRKVKIKYLQKLRSYPVFKREEREIEIRKHKWRQKVKEVLPDYQPVRITGDW